jgi:hypothetical protein
MYYLQGASVRKNTILSDIDNTSSEYLVKRKRLKVCLPNTGLLPLRATRVREPCLITDALSKQVGGVRATQGMEPCPVTNNAPQIVALQVRGQAPLLDQVMGAYTLVPISRLPKHSTRRPSKDTLGSMASKVQPLGKMALWPRAMCVSNQDGHAMRSGYDKAFVHCIKYDGLFYGKESIILSLQLKPRV